MDMNQFRHLLDLPRAEIAPAVFADALFVEHISSLIESGGGSIGRPYLESALRPQQLEVFLARAVETAQKTQCLEHEWRELHQAFSHIKYAWEKGQSLFREDLARAMDDSKEMEILSQEYFAVDLCVFVSASILYFDNAAFQNWAINGYMVAWRKHFSE
jgi:hypothetical protein